MKKVIFVYSIMAMLFTSCDKVKNAYVPSKSLGVDTTLYPGLWSTYPTPVFTANTNTNRNVLIEDFTGHKCTFCPAAAAIAHGLVHDNPDRVFVSTIHSGPSGVKGGFQATPAGTNFTYDFTNPISLAIGGYFGSIPGTTFFGNPNGNVSRIKTSGDYAHASTAWTGVTNGILSANDLKVNLQSKINYYPTTKGAFVHVEVDVLDASLADLALVVAFYQDSIVKPQQDGPTEVLDYVHRDLLKAHINGDIFGQDITDVQKDPATGKYYFMYSYKVPDEYPAENAHFLIYVIDKATLEVYQVIKEVIL